MIQAIRILPFPANLYARCEPIRRASSRRLFRFQTFRCRTGRCHGNLCENDYWWFRSCSNSTSYLEVVAGREINVKRRSDPTKFYRLVASVNNSQLQNEWFVIDVLNQWKINRFLSDSNQLDQHNLISRCFDCKVDLYANCCYETKK